jgi:hypothetical protein
LELAWQYGYRQVVPKSDSDVLIDFINKIDMSSMFLSCFVGLEIWLFGKLTETIYSYFEGG